MNLHTSETHFGDFLIPDDDFETRVQNIGREVVPVKKTPSIFDNLTLDPTFFDEKLAETKGKVQNILAPQEESKVLAPPNYYSEFEKKFPYYSEKFQKILELKKSPTPNDLLTRYAKILLYILEQFQIKGDKKHHVKFMLTLKKILKQVSTFGEGVSYVTKMLEKDSYIRVSGELQEEIELLYSIYYENYVSLQKEMHMQEIQHRKKLVQTIQSIEHDMLGANYRDEEYWGEPQGVQDAIVEKREILRLKRNQREISQKKRNF